MPQQTLATVWTWIEENAFADYAELRTNVDFQCVESRTIMAVSCCEDTKNPVITTANPTVRFVLPQISFRQILIGNAP